MKELLLSVVLLLAATVTAKAQAKLRGPLDEVYLKDGSVLQGKVRAYEIGKMLRLQITPNSYTTIPGDQIEKVVQNQHPEKKKREGAQLRPLLFDGWYNTTSFHALGGYFTEVFEVGLGIQHTFGRRWNQWLGTGVGIGYDNYLLADRVSVVPIHAELTGQFNSRYFSPAYTLQVGYSFANRDEDVNIDDAQGGLLLHAALGFVKHTAEGNALKFDIGYRFQRLKFRRTFDWSKDFDDYRILYKRLAIRFGFTF